MLRSVVGCAVVLIVAAVGMPPAAAGPGACSYGQAGAVHEAWIPHFLHEPRTTQYPDCQFRLYLDGRARYDRPAILARHVGSGSQFVIDIPAQSITEVVLAVPAERRGWLPLGRVLLETRFPLGLFRAWSYVEPDARCLVYPKPERTPLPAPAAEAAAGALRSQAVGNDDFSGLRAYQLSDSPRHVAWKAVARSDDMLTKQFTGESAAELWLDWHMLPAALGLEQRLSRLAGWVLSATPRLRRRSWRCSSRRPSRGSRCRCRLSARLRN